MIPDQKLFDEGFDKKKFNDVKTIWLFLSFQKVSGLDIICEYKIKLFW